MAETIWQAVDSAAAHGSALTITDGDGRCSRSYSSLLEEGARVAAGLNSRGIGPGSRVAVFGTTSHEFVVSALAIWRIGATMVVLGLPTTRLRGADWEGEVRARLAIANAGALLLADDRVRLDVDLPTLDFASVHAATDSPESSAPQQLALIQFTSGSTGSQAGVGFSHEKLIGYLSAHTRRTGAGDPKKDYFVGWSPLFHDQGLIACLLRPLIGGVGATLIPTHVFAADPSVWLQEISRSGGTYSPGPNFAYGLAARALDNGLSVDLSSWSRALISGEMIDYRTVDRFLKAAVQRGFREEALIGAYGMAETVAGVTFRYPGTGMRWEVLDRDSLARGNASLATKDSLRRATFASVGSAFEETFVRVVRNGRAVGDRDVGEIQIKSAFTRDVSLGRQPAGAPTINAHGWLRTGDIGFLSDGELFVTGRAKNTLVVNGATFYAEDLENALYELPDIRKGCCAVVPSRTTGSESVVVIAEIVPEARERVSSVRREVVERLWTATRLRPRDVVIVEEGSLPKTSSGKLRRGAARELYESNAYENLVRAR